MRVLFSLFLLMTFRAVAQDKVVNIRDHHFIIRVAFLDNDSGDSTKEVALYRNNSRLLTHTISKIEGDCNSESVELGSFEVHDTTVVFYSYWARAGDAPTSPFGVRKQVYAVDKNGNLRLIQARLYIETSADGRRENKGIKYLFHAAENDLEKKELAEYVSDVEKTYHGTFVWGAEKDALFKEVRSTLSQQISAATKEWKERYTKYIQGGYKM